MQTLLQTHGTPGGIRTGELHTQVAEVLFVRQINHRRLGIPVLGAEYRRRHILLQQNGVLAGGETEAVGQIFRRGFRTRHLHMDLLLAAGSLFLHGAQAEAQRRLLLCVEVQRTHTAGVPHAHLRPEVSGVEVLTPGLQAQHLLAVIPQLGTEADGVAVVRLLRQRSELQIQLPGLIQRGRQGVAVLILISLRQADVHHAVLVAVPLLSRDILGTGDV